MLPLETIIAILAYLKAIGLIISKWLIGVLIQKIIAKSAGGENGAFDSSGSKLYEFVFLIHLTFTTVAILAVVVGIILAIVSSATSSLALLHSAKVGRKLRKQVLHQAVGCDNKPMTSDTTTSNKDIGQTANELIIKVNLIEDYLAYESPLVHYSLTVLVLSLALTFVFLWYGGIIAVVMVIIPEISTRIFNIWREKCDLLVEENVAKVNSRLLDVVKNGVRIKIMGMQQHEEDALDKLQKESDDPRRQDAWLKFWTDIITISCTSLVPVIIACVSLPFIDRAAATDPAAAMHTGFAFLAAILLLDEAHKSIIYLSLTADKSASAAQAQATIDSFLGLVDNSKNINTHDSFKDEEAGSGTANTNATDLLALAEEGGQQQNTGASGKEDAWKVVSKEGIDQISLDKVTLAYPGRPKPVFSKLDKEFSQGKVYALTGESGKGKSSLVKILAGLHMPQHGTMTTWEGMKVAYVSQDQKLFCRSIRENVSYGAPKDSNDDEIWEALEWASIKDWVETLPNGLDEVLTGGEEDVSGGQLQRLQLAHLYCTCQHVDVVLLDEVLSALDPLKRELLIERLGDFLAGKTAVIVTHHTEMLVICDLELEMDGSYSKPTHRQQRRKSRRASRPNLLQRGFSNSNFSVFSGVSQASGENGGGDQKSGFFSL
ncbi:Cyclolysin secretion/processing ATP-binding protein CyaB [Seminavis robusta]|uniref:Cyclolysin secretion/processing ATP-binding protein CyaB n=1 Tax=Seminavis robusta TaxID=568900 RepID=A0A9N8EBL3_9STRA|nr:Cyclolysin secretion/processing ATP-binding protein CyaB [Seminavis robusta]|eukprot:Sro768_g199700.1 Cyclolysin secretion/processing ATP-binding protein CyaB (660) ;mRNA; f:44387-46366